MQAVKRVGDNSYSGVKTDAELGHRQVVVDRLRHAHRRESSVVQRGGDAQRVVAADADQGVDPVVLKPADRHRNPVLHFERVGARGAEDGSPHG